ncbi:MAG: hypothetical protein R6W84_05970, partial [Promethearchaeia archaeon]
LLIFFILYVFENLYLKNSIKSSRLRKISNFFHFCSYCKKFDNCECIPPYPKCKHFEFKDYVLIYNEEMILDYSNVLDKKVKDLNGEAFEMLDNYIWDNTTIPKEEYYNFSIKKAFGIVKSILEELIIS